MGRALTAAAATVLAALLAIPISWYAGITLAAALDDSTRDGFGFEVADGLVSTGIALTILGPVVVGLGACTAALLGVGRWGIRLSLPLAWIAVLALPAALLVGRVAPDPAPEQQAREPVLARISPFAGAQSKPLHTFNDGDEWESRHWVTRRIDVLPGPTASAQALRHYRGELLRSGWTIEAVEADGAKPSIWAHRIGGRIIVRITSGSSPAAELDLH
jgi:hypothetical protein